MIFSRSERRALERAKEKHISKLMSGGWGPWKDITNEPRTQEIMARMDGEKPTLVWTNGMFIVQGYMTPNAWNAIRLMIRWSDARPDHDWSLFQKIKNELFGPEYVALEVYPAESNKVDVANIYWLWVLPLGTDIPIELKRVLR